MATHSSIPESALRWTTSQPTPESVQDTSSVTTESGAGVPGLPFDLDEAEREANARTRYANYKALVDRVDDVFGDELKASKWLSTPNSQLEEETPLEHARKAGYDLESLEPLLIRMEHGVYA